ncbi:hypothetical protein BC937DRAFT_88325 [Endogone sp. FLAS-F59071]|nr:hypothetical protein BC937DRAFT_88325 [Endogone sp. FLAS-F59071]|eukprot:RUS18796.1 hypothetical protein BC937DRAFT_88325 [Endogone sp. FLAS-F59071]
MHRRMSSAFSSEDYQASVTELKRITKPGGYIELVEYDTVCKQRGPTWTLFQDTFNAALLAGGSLTTDVSNLGAFLTGMESVESDYASFPIGWHGPIGESTRQNSDIFLQVVRPIIKSKLGYTDDQYDQKIQQIRKEWSQYKTWANAYYAYAKKGDGSVP